MTPGYDAVVVLCVMGVWNGWIREGSGKDDILAQFEKN